MDDKIRVAVIGGGLAGCALFNGLLNSPHLEVHMFESKASFRERGIGVALHPNGQNALRAMGLDLDSILSNAGAVLEPGIECVVGVGKHKGQPLLKLPGGARVVARDALLDELLKPLPEDRLHANKKLTSITESSDRSMTIRFADETTFTADLVIGCDGVHSQVRGIILGPDHPATAPTFGGFWDARGTLPTEQAIKDFGTEVVDPSRKTEIGVVCDGFLLLFAQTDNGEKYNVVISGIPGDDWDTKTWKTDIDRGFLDKLLAHVEPSVRKAMIDVLVSEDSPGVFFNQWQSSEAPTYYRDRICVIGDAAHAATPWMGQAASMSFEDAGVMAVLLREVKSKDQIQDAFKAFDETRRGRPEKGVVQRARKVGELLTGCYGLDPEEVPRREMEGWFAELWELDMQRHFDDALKTFKGSTWIWAWFPSFAQVGCRKP